MPATPYRETLIHHPNQELLLRLHSCANLHVTRASSQQHNAVVKTDSAAVVQFFCLRQFTHGVGDFVHVGDYV